MRFSTLELDGSSRRISKQLKQRLLASGCYELRGKLVAAIPLKLRSAAARNHPAFRYVPSGPLPPAEVSGCKFIEPQSDTWREQHRMVSVEQLNAFQSLPDEIYVGA